MNGFELRHGYRGLASYVYRDQWEVVVREDILATRRRFRVMEYNREVARFETLRGAQKAVLKRLLQLALEGQI